MTLPGLDVTVAASVAAAIGDIRRFCDPQRLVAYLIETYPAGTRDHAGLSSPSVHFINGEKHDHHIYPSARFRTD